MPIKWNAAKVSEAMDEVEAQLNYTRPFIAAALCIAEGMKDIPSLPEYINQSRRALSEKLSYVNESLLAPIERIRNKIPDGAVEAEQKAASYGNQQSLV